MTTNGRYMRRQPLGLEDLTIQGPPVRLRDLVAITGLSEQRVRNDIKGKYLRARKYIDSNNATWFIDRADARKWLSKLGFDVP